MDNDNLKEFESAEVKATSIDIENSTFSYIKSENGASLDEQEMYLEDSKYHLSALLMDQRICELCKQICTDGFTPVKDLKSDLTFNLNIPEVKFSSVNEPFVCFSCLHSLNTHTHSIKTNSDIEEKEGLFHIKTEEIDIKSEEEEDRICDDEPCGSQISENRQVTGKTLSAHQHPKSEDGSAAQKYQCGKCAFKSKYKRSLKRHGLKHHGRQMQTFKCYTCNFETKCKKSLKSHQCRHKDIDRVQMYNCPTCHFETKYRYALYRHQLIHSSIISEVEMYKCDECNFATRFKHYLKRHQLRHKDGYEAQMYKCDNCEYKTKSKCTLKRHGLKHKDISKVQMYKCHSCHYETKYKHGLVEHQLTHRDSSEVQMYKCGQCEYETKYKHNVERHGLIHKDVSELQMYTCGTCNRQFKFKHHLRNHERTHRRANAPVRYVQLQE